MRKSLIGLMLSTSLMLNPVFAEHHEHHAHNEKHKNDIKIVKHNVHDGKDHSMHHHKDHAHHKPHQCSKKCNHHKQPMIYKLQNLELSQAYMRPTSDANMPSAAYIVINNTGDQDDKLILVKSDISDNVQIHETKVDAKGVMQMLPIKTGLLIKAKSKTELKPRATHIMLNNVSEALLKHRDIPLKLVFEKSGIRMINFKVTNHLCDKSDGKHHKHDMTKK